MSGDMTVVTLEALKHNSLACQEGEEVFGYLFPDGMPLTSENVLTCFATGLDVENVIWRIYDLMHDRAGLSADDENLYDGFARFLEDSKELTGYDLFLPNPRKGFTEDGKAKALILAEIEKFLPCLERMVEAL